jgi:hypothetical protein
VDIADVRDLHQHFAEFSSTSGCRNSRFTKKYKTAPVHGREAYKGEVQFHPFLISVPDGGYKNREVRMDGRMGKYR